MKKQEPLAERCPNFEATLRNFPKNASKIMDRCSGNNKAELLRELIHNLTTMSHAEIQNQVKAKCKNMQTAYGINLDQICSIQGFIYVIANLIDEPANNTRNSYQQTWKDGFPQFNGDKNATPTKTKKTTIYIDFDFSEYLQQTKTQLQQKQKIIQKLQDMMIDKDNEIDILQQQNNELRNQIEEIAQRTNNEKTSHQTQKQGIQQQVNTARNENSQLKREIVRLDEQIRTLQADGGQNCDQFLRRCLFVQAVSLEHFVGGSV